MFPAFQYSFSCVFVSSFGFLAMKWRNVFHSVWSSWEIRVGVNTSSPRTISAGYLLYSAQTVPGLHTKVGSQESQDLAPSWGQIYLLKHETTSCKAKRLEMLLFNSLIKYLATLSWKELISSVVTVIVSGCFQSI